MPFLEVCYKMGPSCKNLILLYGSNKGVDQLAHRRSMIGSFVVCFLELVILKLATYKSEIF